MLLKYSIKLLNSEYKIILIYDDIESKEEKYHKAVVEIARHIHYCLSAIEGRFLIVKTLIALRAYTFRCNIGRQLEARREYLEKDVILKKDTANLLDIFKKRFEAIESIEKAEKTNSYLLAKKQLFYVAESIEKIGEKLIFNLSNYNLCDSMLMFCKTLTNLEWIAYNEKEVKGAFRIDSINYRVTTETIINAIASITNNQFEESSKYIPNLLYNEKDGTELVSLYIIRFLIQKNIDQVYGDSYINGSNIIAQIRSIFVKNADSDARTEFWTSKIRNVLEYLYNSGVLFRSLYDIETADDSLLERKYNDDYKIYLSPRGKCLYSMLSKNAVLLKLYIQDIHKENSIINHNTTEAFYGILDYLKQLFINERKTIGNLIPDIDLYQEKIGTEFVTSTLLQGVYNNILVYYKNKSNDPDYKHLIEQTHNIYNSMREYSDSIFKKYNVQFIISPFLAKKFDN